ncbi:DUF2911 domain-containing protein [Reichenbachiella agarivorans]|uniref:DUF2911 domain-containing protein n=1 Tax=Reichenbachiella agarivorans TaxID=2979464 RepID=A0ABY6CQB7_9BACT|nr:DUF2911 domain-containing protein [Reichenbachiella agarivorans]UXP32711.1 DUF2911 domain-containing protein [Reichenbachiella agarivorans]
MWKKSLWLIAAIVLVGVAFVVYQMATTKKHSPAETVTYNSDQLNVSVDYCRPFKKGRTIFGELVPYDTYWRTGANEPTIISFDQDVRFGGEDVKAGSYRLYTIPGEDKWIVALNTELEEWGYWEPDYSLDVLRVEVPKEEIACCQEQFAISLPEKGYGTELVMEWDDVKVKVPIEK